MQFTFTVGYYMPSLEKLIQMLMPIESPNLIGMSSKNWFFPYL